MAKSGHQGKRGSPKHPPKRVHTTRHAEAAKGGHKK